MNLFKCVAVRTCQTRTPDGKINFYDAGDSDFFSECPTHFTPAEELSGDKVDFMVISEKLLVDNVIPLVDIVKFYKGKFGDDLTGMTRREAVSKLIYSRTHGVNLLHTQSIVPTAQEFKGAMDGNNMDGIDVSLADPGSKAKVSVEDVVSTNADDGGDELDDLLNS